VEISPLKTQPIPTNQYEAFSQQLLLSFQLYFDLIPRLTVGQLWASCSEDNQRVGVDKMLLFVTPGIMNFLGYPEVIK